MTNHYHLVPQRLQQFDEFFGREPNVFNDFAQKIRGDVSSGVEWNSCDSAVGVPKLLV